MEMKIKETNRVAMYVAPGSRIENLLIIRMGDEPAFIGVDDEAVENAEFQTCHFFGSRPTLRSWIRLWWRYRKMKGKQKPMEALCIGLPSQRVIIPNPLCGKCE